MSANVSNPHSNDDWRTTCLHPCNTLAQPLEANAELPTDEQNFRDASKHTTKTFFDNRRLLPGSTRKSNLSSQHQPLPTHHPWLSAMGYLGFRLVIHT